MLFILWFKFEPENAHGVLQLWKHFTYPSEVKVHNRYLVVGRHMSVAIFDAPNVESILKITAPFSSLGIAHVAPLMNLQEAIEQV